MRTPTEADSLSASQRALLGELVDRFELAADSGEVLSLENLCEHTPELLPHLIDTLRRLNAFDSRLSNVPSLPIPETIGPFIVIEAIGAGSTGMVFRCRQQNPNRDVAVKVLTPVLNVDEQQNRFQREVQAVAAIKEDGMAAVYQTGVVEWCGVRCLWIAMELLPGGTICDFLSDRCRTPSGMAEAAGGTSASEQEVLSLFETICVTLRAAHREGILHRDIQPSNMLMSDDGMPHLVDFGIAKFPGGSAGQKVTETGTPSHRGTTAWMAPELLTGDHAVRCDVRSEIFSLGVVLFEMLTGQHPFGVERLSAAQVAVRIAQHHSESLQALRPEASLDLTAFVEKLMAHSPADRYQNLDDVLGDLERLKNGLPVRVRHVSFAESCGRWIRRNRAAVILTAGFGIAISLGTANWFQSSRLMKAEKQAAETLRQANAQKESVRSMADLHLQLLREQNLRAVTTLPRELKDMEADLLQFRKSRDAFEGYLKLYPEDRKLRQSAGIAFHLLGIAASRLTLHDESFQSFKRAEQVFRELKRDYPEESEFAFDIFSTVLGQAGAHLGTPRSIELHKWCLDLITGLCVEQPDNVDYLDARACVLVNLGHEHALQEPFIDLPYAKKVAFEAHEIAQSICSKPNFKPLHLKHIGTSASVLRVVARREGDHEEALKWSRIAVATQLRFIEHFPDPHSRSVLVRYYLCECEDSLQTGNLNDARRSLDLATSLYETMKHSLPKTSDYQDIQTGIGEMAERVKIKLDH